MEPNWVTCPWPPDFTESLEWQWTERATPYWTEAAAFAKDHGVRVAIELHPGFVAYHTESFWRLREIGGETIGVNFDPSHLFWQGMDPLVCVRELGDAIFHVHAKDTWLDQPNIRRNGVLDTKPYTDEMHRSWIFRTVGYGHGQEFWRALISELRLAGYDGALSIEHEDSLMSVNEGFTSAVEFLKDVVIREPAAQAWWCRRSRGSRQDGRGVEDGRMAHGSGQYRDLIAWQKAMALVARRSIASPPAMAESMSASG